MVALILKVSPWVVLLSALVLGGMSVILANFVYPYAKVQHETEKKKKTLKTLIADESLRNIRVTHQHLKSLSSGSVKISPLDFSALETAVSSGLAQDLKQELFQAILNSLYSLRQAKSIHEKLSAVLLSPPQSQRKVLEGELKPYLLAARAQLMDLFADHSLGDFLSDPIALSDLRQELIEDGIEASF